VGTSGRDDTRWAEVTASARILPVASCDITDTVLPQYSATCPPIRSVSAVLAPL
jgi:hypothetical protein